jgi:hypothetical protein
MLSHKLNSESYTNGMMILCEKNALTREKIVKEMDDHIGSDILGIINFSYPINPSLSPIIKKPALKAGFTL